MPIRPEYRHFYQGEWKTIRQQRLDAAGHKCEWCGVPDRKWIHRNTEDHKQFTVIYSAYDFYAALRSGNYLTFIILTVAHLNHDPSDNRPENLRALCQLCHLRYDMKHHVQSRRMNRRKAAINNGQLEFDL